MSPDRAFAVRETVLDEGRDAPLFHFTSAKSFEQILASDTLKGRAIQMNKQPTISFTRDYGRDFIPGNITAQSLGFRVDQARLAQKFKIQPAVHRTLPDLDKLEKNLSPYNQEQIAKMRQTGNYNRPMSVGGVSLGDIAKKTAAQSNRWESEERVIAIEISNFSQYITGIVIPGSYAKNQSLVGFLATAFRGEAGFQLRNMILESAIKLGVPLIWQRKEYNAEQVKQKVIEHFQIMKRIRSQQGASE
jgi:hypothetical protein